MSPETDLTVMLTSFPESSPAEAPEGAPGSASGVTRIVFYEPVQQKETDEGTINIWDYLETGG